MVRAVEAVRVVEVVEVVDVVWVVGVVEVVRVVEVVWVVQNDPMLKSEIFTSIEKVYRSVKGCKKKLCDEMFCFSLMNKQCYLLSCFECLRRVTS